MSKSKIEWTEVTWNPVLGCAKVSEGCRNCYAMTMSSRIANAAREKENPTAVEKGYMEIVKKDESGKYLPKWTGGIALIEERLQDPIRWQKPRMVFVNSMSDLFHPDVPFEFIDRVFAVMALAEQHTFQVLTKRPERMAEYLNDYPCHIKIMTQLDVLSEQDELFDRAVDVASNLGWDGMPLPNVWLGTSVEDQKAADQRIPHLLKCPAAVRFLSCEPLLGPVDLTEITFNGQLYEPLTGIADLEPGIGRIIHWVIVGGESGPNARPMHPNWARILRDQCQETGVDFFFKQWGAFQEGSDYGNVKTKNHVVLKNGEHAHFFDDDGFENLKKKYRESRWGLMKPVIMAKVGKKEAGRLLDGKEYNEMPEAK